MADFARQYDAALRSADPARALYRVWTSAVSKSFEPDKVHVFFPDLNKKLPWLHALEAQMGVAELWRRGQSVLALGSNGGLVDGYFATVHNHSVTAHHKSVQSVTSRIFAVMSRNCDIIYRVI